MTTTPDLTGPLLELERDHKAHRSADGWAPLDDCALCQSEMAMLAPPPQPPRLSAAELEAQQRIEKLPADPLLRAESLLYGAEQQASLGLDYSARLQLELAVAWLRLAELREKLGRGA